MNPLLVLSGLSALGGIFGRRKQKYLDPTMYNQMFGAKAMSQRAHELIQHIVNSPYGQQLMQSAAEQGQGLQTGLARQAAEAGFGPAGGAASGASDFATAAAPQAVGALQRDVLSGITQQALPIAQQMVGNEADLYMRNLAAKNAEPTTLGRIGTAAAGALPGVDEDTKWSEILGIRPRTRATRAGQRAVAPGQPGFIGPVQ